MTDIEYEALIEHLRRQIADLTAERDRLKAESENSTAALLSTSETNAVLSAENSDMRDALALLGIPEEENENDLS